MNKKLVVSLFLYEKEAITSFDNLTVVSKDAVTLAKMYSDKHADELLVFDLSMGDKEHEEALDVIKAICENIEIPVIGAGNVKRMEDVKKLLYAGCQKAVLNYSKEGNVAITEEVSKKFGKEKIVISVKDENAYSEFALYSDWSICYKSWRSMAIGRRCEFVREDTGYGPGRRI